MSALTFRPKTKTLRLDSPFELESGASLPEVEIAFQTWGRYDGNNAILICHALTGSAAADEWWSGHFGPGKTFDPAERFIICANVLGSCYGTTGPSSNRSDGRAWAADFPAITIRDMVRLQALLLDHLGVARLSLVVGASMGGMQALEWPLLFPERVDALAVIASAARHSAWSIGISEAQRQAIFADPAWQDGHYDASAPPRQGLAAARAIALLSYRSWQSFSDRFDREVQENGAFAVESYLRYQGQKLVDRFDANTYVVLTRAMDSHDVGRGRGGREVALGKIRIPVLIVSIPTDVLYPPAEQEELALLLPNAVLYTLPSNHGHDGFLIDSNGLERALRSFRPGIFLAAA